MFGLIVIVVLGVIFMGLFGTYIYLHYKDNKNAGPMPWHPAYDRARIERVALEKLKEQQLLREKNKNVGVDLEDYL